MAEGAIDEWYWPSGAAVPNEFLTRRWENDGWTFQGRIVDQQIEFVVRLDAGGTTRQFMLFRDDEEPDLWLARDRFGTWGEVNGAVRDDLEGCEFVAIVGSVAGMLLPLAATSPPETTGDRAGDRAGADFQTRVASVDAETLGVIGRSITYRRGPLSGAWSIDGDSYLDVDHRWHIMNH